MSVRIWIHDRHGNHVNGYQELVRARKRRRCDDCGGWIGPGETYSRSTMFPSDSDYAWIDRVTLEPSRSAARYVRCPSCLRDGERDLALLEGFAVHA